MAYEVNYTTASGNRIKTDQQFTKYEASAWARDKNKKSPGSNARVIKAKTQKSGTKLTAAEVREQLARARARKLTGVKKSATKKKSTRSASPGSGLKKYRTFIDRQPAVKKEATRIKKLEAELKAAKKKKAAATKVAAKKYK